MARSPPTIGQLAPALSVSSLLSGEADLVSAAGVKLAGVDSASASVVVDSVVLELDGRAAGTAARGDDQRGHDHAEDDQSNPQLHPGYLHLVSPVVR